MANALITTLGSSGDLNVDVTKYRVFPAKIDMWVTSSYTTIFTGVSWTWAKVIAQNTHGGSAAATFPSAPPIILPSNTYTTFILYSNPYSSTSSADTFQFNVSATSTSLALEPYTSSNVTINLLVMVPES